MAPQNRHRASSLTGMPQPADKSAKKYATGGVARACSVTLSKRVDGLDLEKAAIVSTVLDRMDDTELCNFVVVPVVCDAVYLYLMRGLKFEKMNALAACGCRFEGSEICWMTCRGWPDRKASAGIGPIRARTAIASRCCSDAIAFMM